MYFTKALLLSASFVVAALAQGISITQYPNEGAVASQPTVIGWSGGDGSSTITITLKQGGNVLSTILQRNGQASTFTWTPSDALPDASNYVLEITQGTTVYDTPKFSLTGGQALSSTATASSTTSVASTSSASTTVTVVVSGTTSTTLSPSSTSLPTVSTSIMTTTAPATTAIVVPPVYTNGTAVITPVLTSTTMLSATTTKGTSGTASGSSTSPSVTAANAASGLAGSLAAVLGVFAAVVCLG
ncbi:hypothetical protein MMC17_003778 [Xylographa soralifera]|nr:hypothetical protein [Xylographa soralifera]